MKKMLSVFLIFNFCSCFVAAFSAVSVELQQNVVVEVKKLSESQARGKNINSQLLKKYIPVELRVKNTSKSPVTLAGNGTFSINNEKIEIPSTSEIFARTKRQSAIRAVAWGLIGCGLLSFVTVPASLAYTCKKNNDLSANISRYNLKKHYIFPNEEYVVYTFIPKKNQNVQNISLEMMDASDKSFSVTAELVESL